jgi:hypothetical protein
MSKYDSAPQDDDHDFATDTLPWWRDNHLWVRNVVRRPGEGAIMEQITIIAILGVHLRIHRFFRGDAGVFHNHPRSFVSVCLCGGYRESFPEKQEVRVVRPGTITVRRAEEMHGVEPISTPAMTLALTTPVLGSWRRMHNA